MKYAIALAAALAARQVEPVSVPMVRAPLKLRVPKPTKAEKKAAKRNRRNTSPSSNG